MDGSRHWRGRLAFLAVAWLFVGGEYLRAMPQAQPQNTAVNPAAAQGIPSATRPMRKPDQMANNDPIILIAAREPAAKPLEAAEAAPPVTAKFPESWVSAEETAKKAAEIASLEKQIPEKMKRIALLMRLFVDDERPFLNDPANPSGDAAARERRKYEQDELRWETAELARLRARLNEITASR